MLWELMVSSRTPVMETPCGKKGSKTIQPTLHMGIMFVARRILCLLVLCTVAFISIVVILGNQARLSPGERVESVECYDQLVLELV